MLYSSVLSMIFARVSQCKLFHQKPHQFRTCSLIHGVMDTSVAVGKSHICILDASETLSSKIERGCKPLVFMTTTSCDLVTTSSLVTLLSVVIEYGGKLQGSRRGSILIVRLAGTSNEIRCISCVWVWAGWMGRCSRHPVIGPAVLSYRSMY